MSASSRSGSVWYVDSLLLSAFSARGSPDFSPSFQLSSFMFSSWHWNSISLLSTAFGRKEVLGQAWQIKWSLAGLKYETKAAFTFVWDVLRVQLFRFQLLRLYSLKIFLLVLHFHSSLLIGLSIILVLLRSSCFMLVLIDNIWKQQEEAL